MDIHEYIAYNNVQHNPKTAEALQEYYAHKIKWLCDWYCTESSLLTNSLSIELKVNGEEVYNTFDLDALFAAAESLNKTRFFSIDIQGSGIPVYEDLAYPKGKQSKIQDIKLFIDEIKETENITYKFMSYYTDSDELDCFFIENGSNKELEEIDAEDTVLNDNLLWYSWSCGLRLDCNFKSSSEELQKLRDIVRKYLPENEFKDNEQQWLNELVEPGCLLFDTQWVTEKLNPIKAFSDEINEVLESLKNDYTLHADGTWFDIKNFAVAKWDVLDNMVCLVGVRA